MDDPRYRQLLQIRGDLQRAHNELLLPLVDAIKQQTAVQERIADSLSKYA